MQNRIKLVFICCLLGVFSFYVSVNGHAFEISDLDGTWVDNIGYLSSPSILEEQFVWGIGKAIPNTTLEFEIEKNFVIMCGDGGYAISKMDSISVGIIEMELYSVDDENHKWPVKMKFHFIDADAFWIECPELIGQFPVGKNRLWYRLSGPKR
ncbi:hypothetical protein AGMMS49587_10950 [Spirochaetia bacterium]|nr:hypothetical protein AGMMS49587_10950 [Spirochaetia bacterium]